MILRIYEAKVATLAGGEPVVVSVKAFDRQHAKELLEEKFGPVKQWWSEPRPNLLAQL
jgi:hypothetical protein